MSFDIKTIRDLNRTKSLRQDNKQHCNKIAQGLKDPKNNKPDRAIWELVQNAKDASYKEKDCKIQIILDEKFLRFRHNGRPFNYDTLGSLIKQGSSESKENEDTQGQYGTGFLTTHTFGRKLFIDSSYIPDEENNPNIYIDIDNFLIDREFSDINEEFLDKLVDQLESLDSLLDQPTTPICREWTELRYELNNPKYKENAIVALKKAIDIIPYVLVLNPKIVEFNIKIDTNKEKEELHFKVVDIDYRNVLKETIIQSEDLISPLNNKQISIYHIEDDTNQIKVILPLKSKNEGIPIDGIPRLFLYYPLIGTENWGVNFIIHSDNFIPTEPRNGIIIEVGLDSTKNDEEHNKNIIIAATELVLNYLQENISSISNTRYLAKVKFEYDINNNESFYKSLQDKWVTKFEEFKMIPSHNGPSSIKLTDDFVVFSNSIVKALEKASNESFLKTLHNLTLINIDLPIEDETIEWSNIIYDWYGKDTENYIITLDSIVEGITDVSSNLSSLLSFINESGNYHLFNDYAIIPNREDELRKKSDLRKAPTITGDLYNLAKGLIPNETNKFVRSDFEKITDFAEYNRDNLKSDIQLAVNEQCKIFTKESTPIPFDQDFEKNLLSYCSVFSSNDVKSFRKNLVPLYCKLKGVPYQEYIIPKLNEKEELFDNVFKQLTESIFIYISEQPISSISSWLKSNKCLLQSIISSCINENKQFYYDLKDLCSKYRLYPNQKDELCKGIDLKKEDNIQPKLKELYNRIFTSDHIELKLVDSDFIDLYPFEDITGLDLAKNIDRNLSDDDYKNPIVLDIINIIDDGKLGWDVLFTNINRNKAEIFFKLVDSNKKDSVYKLMQADENVLNKLASLVDLKNLNDIIDKIQNKVIENKNREADFQFKYEVGKHIEGVIRKKIENELDPKKLEFDLPSQDLDVNDEQNGQDIIIRYDSQPIYYIEVKTKWNFSEPAYISKNQMKSAVNNMNNYALCCVDLTNRNNGADVRNYPPVDTIIENTYVHESIGGRLKPLVDPILDADRDSTENKIKLDGDYRGSITKKIFISGQSFSSLIENICNKLKCYEIQRVQAFQSNN